MVVEEQFALELTQKENILFFTEIYEMVVN